MAQNPQQAQIFNHELRSIRRARAVRRYKSGKSAFLLQNAGELAAEKLSDVNRQFQQAVIVGLPAFVDAFTESLPESRKPTNIATYMDWPNSWSESWPENTDLVISGLVVQSRNDLPDIMKTAREAMVADGLFLSALLGGETLLNMRRACFAVDLEARGGAVARIAPMIDLQQAAGLLGFAGFAQPVVDRDKLNITYRSLATLAGDLRDIGESNCLMQSSKAFSGKNFLSQLEALYPALTEDGRFKARFDIIWMSGWTPHASQQKPLKPGSAKKKLSDALREIKES